MCIKGLMHSSCGACWSVLVFPFEFFVILGLMEALILYSRLLWLSCRGGRVASGIRVSTHFYKCAFGFVGSILLYFWHVRRSVPKLWLKRPVPVSQVQLMATCTCM